MSLSAGFEVPIITGKGRSQIRSFVVDEWEPRQEDVLNRRRQVGGEGVKAARDPACCRTWYETTAALGEVTDKVYASANMKTSLGLWLPPTQPTRGLENTMGMED